MSVTFCMDAITAGCFRLENFNFLQSVILMWRMFKLVRWDYDHLRWRHYDDPPTFRHRSWTRLYAYNNSRMVERTFMKSGMDVMQLESTPNAWILILHKLWYQRDGCWNLWGRAMILCHDVITDSTAIDQWPYELLVLSPILCTVIYPYCDLRVAVQTFRFIPVSWWSADRAAIYQWLCELSVMLFIIGHRLLHMTPIGRGVNNTFGTFVLATLQNTHFQSCIILLYKPTPMSPKWSLPFHFRLKFHISHTSATCPTYATLLVRGLRLSLNISRNVFALVFVTGWMRRIRDENC
jgi:hypothetical protein